MVVGLHSTYYIGTRAVPGFPKWDAGYYGVHIFFVISGFVMVVSSRGLVGRPDGWSKFALNRLIRIVPLYWMVTLVKLAVLLAFPTAMLVQTNAAHIVQSFLFIPARTGDGTLEPFYGVGWTLNYEMMFYALFTVCLVFRRNPVPWLTGALVALWVAGMFRTREWPAAAYFYCDPIILNFLWGMLIAELRHRVPTIRLPDAATAAVLGLGLTLAAPYVQILGLQFGALVLGVVYLEPHIGRKLPRWAVAGGTISYALYLVHPMLGPAVTAVVARFVGPFPWVIIPAIFAVSLTVAYCVFRWFEAPASRRLKQITRPDGAQPAPASRPA